jgi:hypothetical protein
MRVRQRAHSFRVIWAPSLARRLIRHRLVRAAGILALGVIFAVTVSSKSAALQHQQEQWGTRAEVAVVQRPVEVGQRVAAAAETVLWPQAMIPPNAVVRVGPDSLAKVALYPGEVVLETRITMSGADRYDAVTAALTLPVAVQVPLLQHGDLVDLWIVDSANLSSQLVVSHVVVLAFSDRDITVAVPLDQVGAATAASLRPVTIALVG